MIRNTGALLRIVAAGFLLPLAAAVPASAEKLIDVLAMRGLRGGAWGVANADRPITSYEVFDSEEEFLIAYYLDDGSGTLSEPLFVSRFDKQSETWRTVAIPEHEARTDEGADCLGAVTGVHATPSGYYVDIHLNPSAGCLLVLSPELRVQRALDGWFLAAFDDGAVVYHRSQVHFAPVHPLEIHLYDPLGDRDRPIYPLEPYQAVRTEHIERLRALYADEEWCRQHNHPCNPEQFDERLASAVELNAATSALAFRVVFEASQVPGSESRSTEVIYIYRNVNNGWPIEYRELLPAELKREFGEVSLRDCLEPELLEEIFAR